MVIPAPGGSLDVYQRLLVSMPRNNYKPTGKFDGRMMVQS